MEKFKLAIGIHNHQPVGNFDSVIDEAHNKAYMPFLKLFNEFDKLKLSLHQSGILWKWQEKRYPEYFDIIQHLLYKERLEIMTGGFYEPILPSIPDRDKLGQIEMLSRYIEGRFGYDAIGLWVTERVWEPNLPSILKQAGVQYVPIDDTHFLYAGMELNQLRGRFITENEGATISILPIQKRLRYLIPFGTVEEVMDELRAQADVSPGGLAVYADDGEKFGVWPKTHEHCYKEGWLNEFFTALSENSDWLEVTTLAKAAGTEPMGRVYLPTASYAEMLQWSLPPMAYAEYEEFEEKLKKRGDLDKYGRFVRGGHWRGFLTKYDESNMMHKRMMMASELFDAFSHSDSENFEAINKARINLYAAQCNCAYWHGVFGGLYLPHLRSAIYENVIRAERFMIPELEAVEEHLTDYDCDGHDEIIVRTNKLTSVIKPSMGGMMVELDNHDAAMNLTDTMRRRKEGYHWKLAEAHIEGDEIDDDTKTESIHDLIMAKESGLQELLTDDWHPKRCFIDHFLPNEVDIEKFGSGQFGDDGDFVLEPWKYDQTGKGSKPGFVRLVRDGHIYRSDGITGIRVEKTFFFGKNSDIINVNYSLTAEEDILNLRFGVENNFNLLAGHAENRYIMFNGHKPAEPYLDSVNTKHEVNTVSLIDKWIDTAIVIRHDSPAEVWQTPIFTVSLSEGGFERVYQGTSLLSLYNLNLKKGLPAELGFMLYTGKSADIPPQFG